MPQTKMTLATLLVTALALGCGDPKGAAGAIGAPAQSMDPSKMNKSAKDQQIEQKYAPADQKGYKYTPVAPDPQQKVTPDAPAQQKVE